MLQVRLNKPGLFVTGTDTEVGKTVVACAVAACLHQQGQRVGVCKPLASGCEWVDGELVNDDAVQLRQWSGCEQALAVINPLRYEPAVTPAAATDHSPNWAAVGEALGALDAANDCVIVEGVGGLLAPLDANDATVTVLELIRAIGYPVLVVTRPGLGTLNHTAMTVRLLRDAGCAVAGLVVNGQPADANDDASLASNRDWLVRMNDAPILATVMRAEASPVQAAMGALADVHWPEVLGVPSASSRFGAEARGLS